MNFSKLPKHLQFFELLRQDADWACKLYRTLETQDLLPTILPGKVSVIPLDSGDGTNFCKSPFDRKLGWRNPLAGALTTRDLVTTPHNPFHNPFHHHFPLYPYHQAVTDEVQSEESLKDSFTNVAIGVVATLAIAVIIIDLPLLLLEAGLAQFATWSRTKKVAAF